MSDIVCNGVYVTVMESEDESVAVSVAVRDSESDGEVD